MSWRKLLCWIGWHKQSLRYRPHGNHIIGQWRCTLCGHETSWDLVILNAVPEIQQMVRQHQDEEGSWVKRIAHTDPQR